MISYILRAAIGISVIFALLKLSGADVSEVLNVWQTYDEIEAELEDAEYDADDYDMDSGYEYDDGDYDW